MAHAKSLIAVVALALGLSACNSTPEKALAPDSSKALPTMERIAMGANTCWFKSGDAAFKAYRMALELNSYSGRPRILLVRAHSPETRPLLVVQAEGHPAKLDAFGPMMDGAEAGRIRNDVTRWARGGTGCA